MTQDLQGWAQLRSYSVLGPVPGPWDAVADQPLSARLSLEVASSRQPPARAPFTVDHAVLRCGFVSVDRSLRNADACFHSCAMALGTGPPAQGCSVNVGRVNEGTATKILSCTCCVRRAVTSASRAFAPEPCRYAHSAPLHPKIGKEGEAGCPSRLPCSSEGGERLGVLPKAMGQVSGGAGCEPPDITATLRFSLGTRERCTNPHVRNCPALQTHPERLSLWPQPSSRPGLFRPLPPPFPRSP